MDTSFRREREQFEFEWDGGWNALRKRLDPSLSLSVSLRTLAAENGKRRIPLCHTVIDINPLDERAPPIGKLNFP